MWALLTETKGTLRPIEQTSSSRSLIAGVNARFRAQECEYPPESRILEDPWSGYLAEDHLLIEILSYLRYVIPGLWREVEQLRTAHCTRHRAFDALILEAIEQGFNQIVLVGAGYDMRATRFAERLQSVRWIEADAPSTSAHKWECLTDVPGINLDVERVPVELIESRLAEGLSASGLDGGGSVCFVLEGLIHYLPPSTLDALLEDIAEGGGARRVLVSFIDPDMLGRSSFVFGNLVKMLREIPRQHYRIGELAANFSAYGFSQTGHWDFEGQVGSFAPQARNRRAGVSQDVAQFDRSHRGPRE
jgi:methyltransferase (TIGR00027 family)